MFTRPVLLVQDIQDPIGESTAYETRKTLAGASLRSLIGAGIPLGGAAGIVLRHSYKILEAAQDLDRNDMLTEKSLTGHGVVIGAGVMGAGIAALLANIGWRVSLLDRVPEDAGTDAKSRNRLGKEGLDRVLKSRPPQFAIAEYVARVRVGNVEDNLDWLQDADWVVEAAAEDPAIKKQLMATLAVHVNPKTIISSNTSGLGLAEMVADCPTDFQSRFLGTHFFNPPRYMKPLELIPAANTDPEIFEGFVRFADRVLGKRVIRAKDTPGFISTRLGMFSLTKTIELAVKHDLTVEEVDYLTGQLLGRPRSGTFRLADVIGLDITARIADNLKTALPGDETYQAIQIPRIMRKLIEEGRVGAKSGAGFYKREKSGEILSLDLNTGEYRPRQEPKLFPRNVEALPLANRLRKLWEISPEHNKGWLREMLQATLGYIGHITPEVSDRIVEVDDALIGGFGWEMGPFHILDALGSIEWPDGEPALFDGLKNAVQPRFYTNEAGQHYYFDFHSGVMSPLPRPADVIVLKDLKKAGKVIEETDSAALVDLGEGVVCFEWRSKMNTLNPELIAFLVKAKERAEQDFQALILGGSGENFSAGFDLKIFAEQIEAKKWDEIDRDIRQFQNALQALKYASVPVVSTAYGYTLGGGCETMLHCDGVQAAFESAIGLPEANVGLIPGGGGTTQILLRAMVDVPPGTILERSDPYPFLRPAWDTLRLARFSSSADEARSLGYLRDSDGITLHPDRLLHDAKERAVSLADSYRPSAPAQITVMGEDGMARFQWEMHLLRRADKITDHDVRVGLGLARVLTGGSLVHPAEVSEQYLLNLEREVFLSLAGTAETLARIRHMLSTGKPLRN
jgi:3-hydroxyacyl-CoA dehydrogenase